MSLTVSVTPTLTELNGQSQIQYNIIIFFESFLHYLLSLGASLRALVECLECDNLLRVLHLLLRIVTIV